MKNFLFFFSITFFAVSVSCENATLEDVPENLQGTWVAESKKIDVGKANETTANETTIEFTLCIYGTTCEQTIKTTYENSEKESSELKLIYTCHYFNGSLWIKTSSTKANTINSTYIEAKVTATGNALEYNGVSYIKH